MRSNFRTKWMPVGEPMTDPVASILIPTRNRAQLLPATLQSAQRQRLDSLEIVVIDDASDDDTESVAQRAQALDQRVRYVRLENREGACHARNLGLKLTGAPYVQFLDSDDLLHPEKLSFQASLLDNNPAADLAVCQVGLFLKSPGDTDRLWNTFQRPDVLGRWLRHDNPWVTVAPLWRRSALVRFGGFEESLETSQDFEHASRSMALGAEALLHPHLLAYYRLPSGPTIGTETLSLRNGAHLYVFRRVFEILSGRGELNSERARDLADSLLWVASNAVAMAEATVAREALDFACRLRPDLPADFHSLIADLDRLQPKEVIARLESHFDRSVREGWWGKARIGTEPLEPVPRSAFRRRSQ